ncbi:hypothetical protein C8Q76DRAFT_690321 [Earliella scabrosa]|nr:hypothetical protein C8Q76DRAFT_690321 [Earliella scabrosa]
MAVTAESLPLPFGALEAAPHLFTNCLPALSPDILSFGMGHRCRLCCKTYPTTRAFFTHHRKVHAHLKPPPPKVTTRRHPHLNARPCDKNGNFLPPNSAPPPQSDEINWQPFPDRSSFEFAKLAFEEAHLSKGKIKRLLQILATKHHADGLPEYNSIYKNQKQILEAIDAIEHGEASWRTFAFRYPGPVTPTSPSWKREVFLVHTQDTLRVAEIIAACPDFEGKFDCVPTQEFTTRNCRCVSNLMTAQWVWQQANNKIAEDPDTHGSMIVPIVLGADKTTVSVATGNQEFRPLYMSLGNLHNEVRRAHRDSAVPIAFLAIPTGKSSIILDVSVHLTHSYVPAAHEWEKDKKFRIFKKQIYHASLVKILEPLRAEMTTPHVLRCPDGHFHHAIFKLGLFIADYPEQVYLSGIVSGWCPKCYAVSDADFKEGDPRCRNSMENHLHAYNVADLWDLYSINPNVRPYTTYFPHTDIHKLLTSDLLHQLIKGTSKDHLVAWVLAYIKAIAPSEREANKIIDDINCRYEAFLLAAMPPFPGLRRFPQGCNFKQWMGNDSKALMKCLTAFLNFVYLVRRPSHDTHSLHAISGLIARCQALRAIFLQAGVWLDDGFALPRQHALFHYVRSIEMFGSLYGLCTSITESKHISAVKQPWRDLNRRNPLGQILRKITRLNKLAAARAKLSHRNMLHGNVLSYVRCIVRRARQFSDADNDNDNDDSLKYSSDALSSSTDSEAEADERYRQLAEAMASDNDPAEAYVTLSQTPEASKGLHTPDLVGHLCHYLYSELNPDAPDPDDVPLAQCPYVWPYAKISIYHT